MRRGLGCALCGLLICAGVLPAENYYVHNIDGRDQNDGLADAAVNASTGPLKTIRRAMELAGSGDTILITNTGTPYYESLTFVGERLSGVESVPFTIVGNGAILSGLRGLPRQGWRRVEEGLWQVTFNRKGFYKLLRDGVPLTEYRPENSTDVLETLPPGQWCAFRGSVYFRQDGLEEPGLQRFDYAADEVGITFYHVEHVRIVDLTIEHFRLDGINAQNMCNTITLEDVICRENGRAGVAVGGTSSVSMQDCKSEGNGRFSALVTGKGSLNASGTEFDVEPEVKP
jgi:hypothetical protein